MGRFFWLIIAAVAIVVLLLMSNNDSGSTLGMDNDVFARAAYLGIWGVVLAAGLLGSGINRRRCRTHEELTRKASKLPRQPDDPAA